MNEPIAAKRRDLGTIECGTPRFIDQRRHRLLTEYTAADIQSLIPAHDSLDRLSHLLLGSPPLLQQVRLPIQPGRPIHQAETVGREDA
jgi:hypothetical protein